MSIWIVFEYADYGDNIVGVYKNEAMAKEKHKENPTPRYIKEYEVEDDRDESYTAFAYEDDGVTIFDESTYDTKEEAVEFAKARHWDEVVNDITGEIVWQKIKM